MHTAARATCHPPKVHHGHWLAGGSCSAWRLQRAIRLVEQLCGFGQVHGAAVDKKELAVARGTPNAGSGLRDPPNSGHTALVVLDLHAMQGCWQHSPAHCEQRCQACTRQRQLTCTGSMPSAALLPNTDRMLSLHQVGAPCYIAPKRNTRMARSSSASWYDSGRCRGAKCCPAGWPAAQRTSQSCCPGC